MNPSGTIKAGLYQHFKGNNYYVFDTAKHSENEEIMVIYAPNQKRDELWVRPLNMFFERVKTETGEVQRFTFIESEM